MPYKVKIIAPDSSWVEDRIFETEEDAVWYGDQCMSDAAAGAEVLHLSNPGDYDDWDNGWKYRVIKVKK